MRRVNLNAVKARLFSADGGVRKPADHQPDFIPCHFVRLDLQIPPAGFPVISAERKLGNHGNAFPMGRWVTSVSFPYCGISASSQRRIIPPK